MNIIEAIQAAENGKLITNSFKKRSGRFLIYATGGVFFEYEIVGNNKSYKYEIRDFSMGDILHNAWECFDTLEELIKNRMDEQQ